MIFEIGLSVFWIALALAGFCRAVYLANESRKDRAAILPLGNGRLIVVTAELEHRIMGIFIYLSLLMPGLLAFLYGFEAIPLWWRLVFAPASAVVALVLLVVRQERDVVWLRRHWEATSKAVILADEGKLDRIDSNTADTNRMLREGIEAQQVELDAKRGELDERARRLSERGEAQDRRGAAQDERERGEG